MGEGEGDLRGHESFKQNSFSDWSPKRKGRRSQSAPSASRIPWVLAGLKIEGESGGMQAAFGSSDTFPETDFGSLAARL